MNIFSLMQMKINYHIVLFFVSALFSLTLWGQDHSDSQKSVIYDAVIDKNLEADVLLTRARDSIKAEQYQDALTIIKKLLDQYSQDLVATKEEALYIPFYREILLVVQSLPAEIREKYLVEINQVAFGLYKEAIKNSDVTIFEDIFYKYYMSDYGDDAAEFLGYRAMEKGYNIQAVAFLEKALTHPHSSIEPSHLQLSLYYLYRVIGREADARSLKVELQRVQSSHLKLERIENYFKDNVAASSSDDHYLDTAVSAKWLTIWQKKTGSEFIKKDKSYTQAFAAAKVDEKKPASIEEFIALKWKKSFWYPVNQSILRKGRLYIRNVESVMCYLPETDELLWEARLEKDPLYSDNTSPAFKFNLNGPFFIPLTLTDILLFSDRVSHQIDLVDDLVFVIANHHQTGAVAPLRNHGVNGFRKSEASDKGNTIYALDSQTGKKLWKLNEEQDQSDLFFNAVFLHLPLATPYGYYITFCKGSEVYSALLDEKRKVKWSRYICNIETNGSLALDNTACLFSEDAIFATIGRGIIVKLNSLNGHYDWIKRYPVNIKQNAYMPFLSVKPGIEKNSLISYKGRLVVLPSDTTEIFVLNQMTGEVLYSIEDDFKLYRRYLIGSDETGFYMAGQSGLIKYSYEDSKPIWKTQAKNNFGHACLSGHTILFPMDQSLGVIDKMTGQIKTITPAVMEDTFRPIGNVTIDDKSIAVTDFDSVYVLKDSDSVLDSLNLSLEKEGAFSIRYRRGLLFLGIKKYHEAFEDFLTVFEKAPVDDKQKSIYLDSVLDTLEELKRSDDYLVYLDRVIKLMDRITENGQKSYLFFIQGEEKIKVKKYEAALQDYAQSLSLIKGVQKSRSIKQNDISYSIPLLILFKIKDLWQQNLISSESMEAFFAQNSVEFDESLTLTILELFDETKLYKGLVASVLTNYQKFDVAVSESFWACVKNFSDPSLKLAAQFYLLRRHIVTQGYYAAIRDLEKLKAIDIDGQIYNEAGVRSLKDTLEAYTNGHTAWEGAYDPRVRRIVGLPISPLWDYKTIFKKGLYSSRCRVLSLGAEQVRPEYLERNILVYGEDDTTIHSVSMADGKVNWSYSVPFQKNESIENFASEDDDSTPNNPFQIRFRMEGVALLTLNMQYIALDLSSGKEIWNMSRANNRVAAFKSGSFVQYAGKEITVFDGFTGRFNYELFLKEDADAVYVHQNRLIVFHSHYCKISIFGLFSGQKIKEIEVPYSLYVPFKLFTEDSLVVQEFRGQLLSFSLITGELNWKQPFEDRVFNTDFIFSVSGEQALFYGNKSFLYSFNPKNGKIQWQYKVNRKGFSSIDINPISDGKSILVAYYGAPDSWQAKQDPLIDHVFFLDMKTGQLQNKIEIQRPNSDQWNSPRTWVRSIAGDVIPCLNMDEKHFPNIQFFQKKDGEILKEFSVPLDSSAASTRLFAKGHFLLVVSEQNITVYGNLQTLKQQSDLLSKMKVFFDEM